MPRVRGMRSRCAAAAVAITAAAGLGACGGDDSPDIDAPTGDYPVQVTRASFPARQHIAADTDLVLTVRNTGDKAIPDLTATIWTGGGDLTAPKASGAFSAQGAGADGASDPVWLTVQGFPKQLAAGASPRGLATAPAGGANAAQTNSFTLGTLAAGATRTIVWRVTPVRRGSFVVRYALAAGIGGGAKAVTSGGATAGGAFRVRIDETPRGGCVVADADPYRGDCS